MVLLLDISISIEYIDLNRKFNDTFYDTHDGDKWYYYETMILNYIADGFVFGR